MTSREKSRSNHSRSEDNSRTASTMSPNTIGFLQKICYKQAASVDMTQHGFISDSKVQPVNLLMKPLRKQLEKICGSGSSSVGYESASRNAKFKKSSKGKGPVNQTSIKKKLKTKKPSGRKPMTK